MKYFLFTFLLLTTLISCGDDTPELDCVIEGRWIVEGLNESTLYEFTDGLRYTIYKGTDEVFGTIEDAIPNPHEYSYAGDSLVIDLNFGNFSTRLPVYKCDCNVVELTDNSGASILYKEGYNYEDCGE